jgi:hypothetical protein
MAPTSKHNPKQQSGCGRLRNGSGGCVGSACLKRRNIRLCARCQQQRSKPTLGRRVVFLQLDRDFWFSRL